MTEVQKNIFFTVQSYMSNSKVTVTEDLISQAVDMHDKTSTLFGKAPLTEAERDEVIAALHAALLVRIDRGHCLKEKDHTPWYIAAKADQPCNFWDRYRIYLQKEQQWNGQTWM